MSERSRDASREGCPHPKYEPCLVLPALALLVPWVLTDDHHPAVPADHLALLTYLLDARSYFHNPGPSKILEPIKSAKNSRTTDLVPLTAGIEPQTAATCTCR